MRKVGIWVSGLLASAIPFIFVGALMALLACVFDAVGEHRPTAHYTTSFQAEAAPTEQVAAVASANALENIAQRQPSGDAHDDARHHGAARSGSQPRMRHTAVVNGQFAPSSRPRFAKQSPNAWHNQAIW